MTSTLFWLRMPFLIALVATTLLLVWLFFQHTDR